MKRCNINTTYLHAFVEYLMLRKNRASYLYKANFKVLSLQYY